MSDWNQIDQSDKHYFSFISVTPSNLGGLPLKFFVQVGAGQLSFASEQTGSDDIYRK
jgi:hypothetical protein